MTLSPLVGTLPGSDPPKAPFLRHYRLFALPPLLAIGLHFCVSRPSQAAPYLPPLNLQLNLPPLPAPSFTAGRKDSSTTLLYAQTEGDGFKLTGGGIQFIGRKAYNDGVAWDGVFSFSVAKGTSTLGDYGEKKSTLVALNFQTDVEFQFLHARRASVVGYVGFALPVSFITAAPEEEYTDPRGTTYDLSPYMLYTALYGVPMGLKGAVSLTRFARLSGHVGLVDYLGGRANPHYRFPGYHTPHHKRLLIDPFVSTTGGAEITFVPWGWTVGLLHQRSRASSGSLAAETIPNVEVKSTFVYTSWHFGT